VGEAASHAAALALERPCRAPGSRYEVLLGADVVYWAASVRPLVETAAALLARPGGVWLLGYTARVAAMRPALLAAAESAGLRWEVLPWCFSRSGGAEAEGAELPVPSRVPLTGWSCSASRGQTRALPLLQALRRE